MRKPRRSGGASSTDLPSMVDCVCSRARLRLRFLHGAVEADADAVVVGTEQLLDDQLSRCFKRKLPPAKISQHGHDGLVVGDELTRVHRLVDGLGLLMLDQPTRYGASWRTSRTGREARGSMPEARAEWLDA